MITFSPLLNPLAAPFTLSLPSSLFHITSLRSELLWNRGRAQEGEAFCNWECHVQCILVTGLRGQKWFSVVVWWKVSCQTRAMSNPPSTTTTRRKNIAYILLASNHHVPTLPMGTDKHWQWVPLLSFSFSDALLVSLFHSLEVHFESHNV